MAATLALAAGLWVTRGLPARLSPEAAALAEARYDSNPRRDECLEQVPGHFCRVGAAAVAPSFLLWGDSHADSLQPGVERAAQADGTAGYIATRRSCAPLIGVRQDEPGCTDAGRAMIAWLKLHPEVRTVVLIARWPFWRSGTYYAGEPGPPHPLSALTPDRAGLDHAALFDAAVADTLNALKATGKRVVVLGDVPEIGWDVPTRLFAAYRFGTTAPAPPTAAQARARQAGAERVFHALGADYVPLLPYFCRRDCRVTVAGAPLYVDDDHLSATGARAVVAPMLSRILR
jgi:hypothetical protein